jgi:hypothetical protein
VTYLPADILNRFLANFLANAVSLSWNATTDTLEDPAVRETEIARCCVPMVQAANQ